MNTLIENNFNTVLIISAIAGLTLPSIEFTPNIVVSFLLGVTVFFLCAKITISEIRGIVVKHVITFYILRFIVLPIILFYIADAIIPRYASGVLLLALMPVGISTPILVGTQSGNVTQTFVLMIASSLIAPFIIPVLFMLTNGSSNIEISGLFYNLFSVVLVPFIAYFMIISAHKKSKQSIENNSSFIAVLLLGIIIAIVISKQRNELLTNLYSVGIVLIMLCLLFVCFYYFGWLFSGKNSKTSHKISYSLSSGATNTALGINLSLIYFSKDTAFFMVLSEFVWVLAIPVFSIILKKLNLKA